MLNEWIRSPVVQLGAVMGLELCLPGEGAEVRENESLQGAEGGVVRGWSHEVGWE